MIIDLNIRDRLVIVIGGGNEALKRIQSLLKQRCQILLISEKTNPQINRFAKSGKIKIVRKNVQDMKFISKFKPFMIITTTDNKKLNQNIINAAKKRRILAYSSDNPDNSDFSNPAIIDFEKIIQIAIFTGGKSPLISKKIKIETEKILKKIVTKEYLHHIRLQEVVRKMAKERIATAVTRKAYINSVMRDKDVDQLIKDGYLKKAEKRSIEILESWT